MRVKVCALKRCSGRLRWMRSAISIGAEILIIELEMLSPMMVCRNALGPTGSDSSCKLSGITTRRRKPTAAIMVISPVLELMTLPGSTSAA